MSIYYVTALFMPSGDIFRPIHKYIENFHYLADSGVPIGVYLDPSLREFEDSIVGRRSNVTILDYVVPDRSFLTGDIVLPLHRNESKDTVDYMAIQLMKLNLCARASVDYRIGTPNIAWIDFGIFHMIADKERSQTFLHSYKLPERYSRILSPGCWEGRNYGWDKVAWRYCGSLLIGPRDAWIPAYSAQQKKVLDALPRITWEVNIWAELELFDWYKADHNDSMILNLPTV